MMSAASLSADPLKVILWNFMKEENLYLIPEEPRRRCRRFFSPPLVSAVLTAAAVDRDSIFKAYLLY